MKVSIVDLTMNKTSKFTIFIPEGRDIDIFNLTKNCHKHSYT